MASQGLHADKIDATFICIDNITARSAIILVWGMIWTVIKTFFVRMIAGCILAAPSLDRFGTPVGILN